jgi:hypothetical protein
MPATIGSIAAPATCSSSASVTTPSPRPGVPPSPSGTPTSRIGSRSGAYFTIAAVPSTRIAASPSPRKNAIAHSVEPSAGGAGWNSAQDASRNTSAHLR